MYVNAKMIPAEAVPGIRKDAEGEKWRGWIEVWYIWYTAKNLCKCYNVQPPSTTIKGKNALEKKKQYLLSIKCIYESILIKKFKIPMFVVR
jgi:hypothetical protein